MITVRIIPRPTLTIGQQPPQQGTGNVSSDGAVTPDRIAVFDGATGFKIKDGGKTIQEVIDSAPVKSVNTQTGDVNLDASDVGAYPDTNPSNFVDATGAAAAAPVQSVNGQTGVVQLNASDVAAVPTAAVGQPNGVASLGADGRVEQENSFTQTWRNGGWFGNTRIGGQTTTTNYARTAGHMLPLLIHSRTFIDACAFQVTTEQPNGLIRVALYKAQPNGTKTLHYYFGEALCNSIGVKTITTSIPIELPKGFYWIVGWHPEITGALPIGVRAQPRNQIQSQYVDINVNYFTDSDFQSFPIGGSDLIPETLSNESVNDRIASNAIYIQLRAVIPST